MKEVSKMLALTPQEQARVEENMGLVGMVLRDYIHTPPPGSVYTVDDLYQIGCIGLCKAVQTDKAGHSAAFSTYASRLIRNEIYDALEYSTRHSREQATAPEDLPHVRVDDELEQHMLCGALLDQLDRAEATATGTVAKGIRAIRLLAQGYTNREIGEEFQAPANHVTAWVAKARKHLAAMAT
jgi:RNA polymerase sigma factor (sigma-70 family)